MILRLFFLFFILSTELWASLCPKLPAAPPPPPVLKAASGKRLLCALYGHKIDHLQFPYAMDAEKARELKEKELALELLARMETPNAYISKKILASLEHSLDNLKFFRVNEFPRILDEVYKFEPVNDLPYCARLSPKKTLLCSLYRFMGFTRFDTYLGFFDGDLEPQTVFEEYLDSLERSRPLKDLLEKDHKELSGDEKRTLMEGLYQGMEQLLENEIEKQKAELSKADLPGPLLRIFKLMGKPHILMSDQLGYLGGTTLVFPSEHALLEGQRQAFYRTGRVFEGFLMDARKVELLHVSPVDTASRITNLGQISLEPQNRNFASKVIGPQHRESIPHLKAMPALMETFDIKPHLLINEVLAFIPQTAVEALFFVARDEREGPPLTMAIAWMHLKRMGYPFLMVGQYDRGLMPFENSPPYVDFLKAQLRLELNKLCHNPQASVDEVSDFYQNFLFPFRPLDKGE